MKNLKTWALGWSMAAMLPLATAESAQSQHACAQGRIQQTARKVAATPYQNILMGKYDVNFYKLDLALERTSTFTRGNVLIQAKSKVAALDTFAFELHQNLQIDSITINQVRRSFSRNGGEVVVPMITPVGLGQTVAAKIYYNGTPPTSASAAIGNGMSNATSPSWGNRVTWSLSQPFAAYEWWPCKQILSDKADSVEVHVTTSSSNKVGSNGLLQQVVNLPNNKSRYEWKSRYPIAYYLISVAVAEYVEYNIYANPAGAAQPILIQNYIYNNPGTLATYQQDIDDTAPLLENFSSVFGLYPFYQEKYGHSMAPLSGGMEHQTMTTQGFFEFTLTAHELAHQWFGDHVTCATWKDIWLNEGFASYCEYIAYELFNQPQLASGWMTDVHNSVMRQPGGSVYVYDTTNVNRIFNGRLTYNKGAAVVHMLRYEVNNDSLFYATLRQYQQLFGDSVARTSDLQQVFEQATSRSLNDFFQQWVYGEGFPSFGLRWKNLGNNQLLIETSQTTSTSVTPLFKTPLDINIRTTSGDTLVRVYQNQAVQQFVIPVSGNPITMFIDPQNWLLNGSNGVVRDQSLVLGSPTSLEKQQVYVYPNPANDKLYLSGITAAIAQVKVMDITGRVVVEQQYSGGELQVQHLKPGRYLVQVVEPQQVVNTSFIKN